MTTSRDYDDMGPRIDLGQNSDDSAPVSSQAGSPPKTPRHPLPSSAPASGKSAAGLIALLLVVPALLLGVWNFFYTPEPPALLPISADAVPGATAERVAKLEKDVSSLILRMVTMEKETQAMGAKAGSVTKLAELSAKVSALQDRLESLALEKKLQRLAKAGASARSQSKATSEAADTPKPARSISPGAKPPAKAPIRPPKKRKATSKTTTEKLIYVVKRGDTLFTIAQRYKVRTSDLMRWNRLGRRDVLKTGKPLTIYITK